MVTPPESLAAAKPKRRWLQFSLRSLFVATTLLCIWLGWQAHHAAEQRTVIAYLRDVHRDARTFEFSYSYDKRTEEVWAPAWLQTLVGEDYFKNVTEVTLTDRVNSGNFPSVVAQLRRLPRLKHVYLLDVAIRDDDLRHLPALVQIKSLSINCQSRSELTGVGIGHLAGMDNLEELALFGHGFHHEAFAYVPKLKHLKSLTVRFGLDNRTLALLADCPELERLDLTRCNWCRGSTIRSVAKIRSLRQLSITNTYVWQVKANPSATTRSREEWYLDGSPTWSAEMQERMSSRGGLSPEFVHSPDTYNEFVAWLRGEIPRLDVNIGHFFKY